MHDPREVFDNPHKFWDWVTATEDVHCEGQHFDRKEACRPDDTGKASDAQVTRFKEEHVKASISAFANANNLWC